MIMYRASYIRDDIDSEDIKRIIKAHKDIRDHYLKKISDIDECLGDGESFSEAFHTYVDKAFANQVKRVEAFIS